MTQLFRGLRQHQNFQGLDPVGFSVELARFLADLNAIHPFRDGNGRTQMAFLDAIAVATRHPLDISNLDGHSWMGAMIESFGGESEFLAVQIRQLLRS